MICRINATYHLAFHCLPKYAFRCLLNQVTRTDKGILMFSLESINADRYKGILMFSLESTKADRKGNFYVLS